MVKAQIFVDVGGCRFTGRNGADDRGRTGDAVASGKYPFHIRDLCTGIGSRVPPLWTRIPLSSNPRDSIPLTNGHNNHICRDSHCLRGGGSGPGAACRIRFSNHLRLCPKCGCMAVFVGFNPQGSLKR